MADRSVNISLNSNGVPQVDNDPIRIKRQQDQVVWQNNSDQTVTVAFTSSPFGSSSYVIRPHASRGSGPSNADPRNYKYSITVDSTGKKLDPTVIIEN